MLWPTSDACTDFDFNDMKFFPCGPLGFVKKVSEEEM